MKYFFNKKVLITGHTGFKGSWLSLWMVKSGAKVFGLANNFNTEKTNFKKFKINTKVKNYNCDIRNYNKFKKIILDIKPRYIFHLAAQSLVKRSYDQPLYNFETNFNGTLNLLETLRLIKFKCTIVIITSDKSYKNLEIKRGYRENDLLGGEDPYSASKGSAEIIINSYFSSFLKFKKNIRLGIARAGNVIGGGDWSENRIVPDIIRSVQRKKSVQIRRLNATRPWQHVLEVLNGYMIFARKLDLQKKFNGEAFNFGPSKNSNYSVSNLLLVMRKKWKEIKWKKSSQKFKESTLLKLNSSKANKKLNWKNKLKFTEVVGMIVKWHKGHLNKENMYQLSINQIKYFENK